MTDKDLIPLSDAFAENHGSCSGASAREARQRSTMGKKNW